MSLELWTLAIGVVTACACAISGVLLVVNREAMVSEGLSHAVLPGIIIAFVLTHDRSSPLLIVGAAAMGLLMVLLVQAIRRTRVVEADASLGIVFPALFSIGIILASRELAGVHFHAHCIIDGNLALAPLDRLVIGGERLGPKSFYVMLIVTLVLVGFITLLFKELKLMVFDGALARSFGFRPGALHIAWLTLVSLTTVSAFEAAGSILVVALTITPPATAYLLTSDLRRMFLLSALIGAASAVLGFYLGLALDISPAGPMSSVAGGLFLLALLFAPKRGLRAKRARRRRQQRALERELVLLRICDEREGGGVATEELATYFPWSVPRLREILSRARGDGLIDDAGGMLRPTAAAHAWLAEHSAVPR